MSQGRPGCPPGRWQGLCLLHAVSDHAVISRLGCALLVVSAGGLLSGLAPLALKELVDVSLQAGDALHTPPDLRLSVWLAAAYVGALATARVLSELRPLLAGSAEQRLNAHLMRHGFKRLLGLPLSTHLQQRTGALVQTLDQAAAGCQLLVSQLVGNIVPVVVELCTVVAVLVHLGQTSFVVAFAATALAYVGLHMVGTPPVARRAKAVAEAAQGMRAASTEGLLHPESVKGLDAEAAVCRRVDQSVHGLERRWRELHLQRARLGLAVSACFGACLAALMALALQGLHLGTLTVGSFVLVNVYLLQMMRPLDMLGAATRDVAQALGFIKPLLQVLDNEGEAPRLPSAGSADEIPSTATPPSAPSITIRALHFSYDDRRPVLRGLNLDVAPGSTLALVGPSGCGKSSLLRLLLRLYEPQSGVLLLDGRPLADLPIRQLRVHAGVVFQETMLLHDTLAANIALGCASATAGDIRQAARQAQLHDFVATLPAGYDTPVGERGLKLSGGERQRIGIARALVRRPRLLILDEATSMLDGATEAALLGGLRQGPHPCTTLLIAHRLSSIRHADRIAVLEAGRVVATGDHATLLAQGGTYARLWHAQVPPPGSGAPSVACAPASG